jgi:hypothetical protein
MPMVVIAKQVTSNPSSAFSSSIPLLGERRQKGFCSFARVFLIDLTITSGFVILSDKTDRLLLVQIVDTDNIIIYCTLL